MCSYRAPHAGLQLLQKPANRNMQCGDYSGSCTSPPLQQSSPMRALALVLGLALLAPCLGQRLQAKCSACRAVTRELADRLDKERPRNHLDMRHRLDKHGNRYGKVIDYKLSELRIIELLEGLCSAMIDYEFVPANKNGSSSSKARWARSSELGVNRSFDLNKMRLREDQRLLGSYCSDLVERHEDEVAAAIRGAKVDANGISDFLCYELSKHCNCKTRQEDECVQITAGPEPSSQQGSASDAAAQPSATASEEL